MKKNRNLHSMEDRVMYNVLKSVRKKEEDKAAPDQEYLKSLENVGIIKLGWGGATLTPLGASILGMLQNHYEKW